MRALRPALLLIFSVTIFSAIDPVWRIDPDAAAYLSLGNAVGSGEGYVLGGALHGKYPPGWPWLVAGLGRVFGADAYGVFHAALVAAWALAVLLAHRLARRLGLGPWPALAVAACVALSQTLFELSVRYLRTEPLFLALSLAALLVTIRATSRAWRGGAGAVVLAGLLVVATLSVRLAGVSLLAVPAVALLRKDTRRGAALAVLALGAAGLLGWMAWGAHVRAVSPEAPDYRTEFLAAEPRDLTKVVQVDVPPLDGPALARRVGGNVGVLARAGAVLLTNVDKAGARAPVGYLVLIVLLVGCVGLVARAPWRGAAAPGRADDTAPADASSPGGSPSPDADVRRTRLLCAAYLGATLALHLVWPFDQQERFYVPLLPLLLVAALEGAVRLGRALAVVADRPAGRAATLLGAVAVLVLLALQRSDDPVVLGRWSRAYAALLGAGVVGTAGLAWWLHRGRALRLPSVAWLLLPAFFALPFAALRFREWPAIVRASEETRAVEPAGSPLARIDVHPVLADVARFLATTPPDTVLMTDVPKMLAVLSGRRCVPFVYRADPPEVLVGDADLVFYTRELPQAAAVMDAAAARFEPALELPAVDEGAGAVRPTVYRVP